MIDRERLRLAPFGPAKIRLARKLGYGRKQFGNQEVLAYGSDWVFAPQFSLSQAAEFAREWAKLPWIEPKID